MTVRNLKMISHNNTGLISSTATNAVIHYQNVDYLGPQIIGSINSGLILEDSKIVVTEARLTETKELSKVRNLTFRGNTDVILDGHDREMMTVTNLLLFETNSHTKLSSPENIIKSPNGSIRIESEAYVEFTENFINDVVSADNLFD